MAISFRKVMDKYRWHFQEKGMQTIWNELNQVADSILGSSVVGGTTSLSVSTFDVTSENFVESDATNHPWSGSFGSSNAASGRQILLPDPGGNIGPTPLRTVNGNSTAPWPAPTAGFHTP